jgi:DNA-binding FrmR family transcriptional regulator
MSIHTSHPDIIKRLKRASGHLTKVISMLETGSECIDVAQQLHAVESAITNAKRTFIRDHIDHCLEHTLEDKAQSEKAVREFKEITKYL